MHRVRGRESATHLSPSKSEENDRGCYPSEQIGRARERSITRARTRTHAGMCIRPRASPSERIDRLDVTSGAARPSGSIFVPKSYFRVALNESTCSSAGTRTASAFVPRHVAGKYEKRGEFARQQAPDTSIQRMHAADSSSSPSRGRDQSSRVVTQMAFGCNRYSKSLSRETSRSRSDLSSPRMWSHNQQTHGRFKGSSRTRADGNIMLQ